MPTIVITVGADGNIKELKVDGVNGPTCKDLTKNLENALGKVTDRKLTTDYYKKPEVTDSIKVGR